MDKLETRLFNLKQMKNEYLFKWARCTPRPKHTPYDAEIENLERILNENENPNHITNEEAK